MIELDSDADGKDMLSFGKCLNHAASKEAIDKKKLKINDIS